MREAIALPPVAGYPLGILRNKKVSAMPDTEFETSAESSVWSEEPKVSPRQLNAFVGSRQPIVPPAWRSEFLAERWIEGRPCAVQPATGSTRLLVDVTFSPTGYTFGARYYYEDAEDALLALRDWDGQLDPPGPWIQEGVSKREGPGALEVSCSGGIESSC